MKYINNLLLTIVFAFSGTVIFGQSDSAGMVKYSTDFKFKEGIYINFDQVKENDPIPKSRILTSVDYDDQYFFDHLQDQKKIYYYDKIGTKHELVVKNLWGYSRNGFLYININGSFFRITYIGKICHFVAMQTTYTNAYNNPYYNNNYYYSPYQYNPQTYQTTEMRQYLLDFETGKVYDYNDESIEILLMKDPELYDEYMALRKKKKKQLKFLYIRKFNERNPLYFLKSSNN